jgi:hAT family C-terminal dimerisation region
MARDILGIPATGSGVEWRFSRSSRVANAARNRLDPSTVRDIMIYKSHLASRGKPLHIRPLRMLEDDMEEGDDDIPEEWEEEYNSTRADLYKRLTRETTQNRNNESEEDDIYGPTPLTNANLTG